MSDREHPTIAAAKARERGEARDVLRARGVVHTPMELARFGLRRIDAHLRLDFGLSAGLADPSVLLIDPAVGTGVWLAAALEFSTAGAGRRAMWGFDVDAVALETTRRLLEQELDQRRVELTLSCENTLAIADPWPRGAHGVRVIVGNPPWGARSASRGTELSDRWLADFRREPDGTSLAERRVGVLSDDYVRFFRWSLEQARTAPAGAVLCLATNGSFLDGPVHRGMRAALREAFDVIEVLDLGGNALLARGRERDENVFGVRVGAALTLALRRPSPRSDRARVYLARLTGTREQKLSALAEASLEELSALEPSAPWSRGATPRTPSDGPETVSLAEAFPFHREGVQTNRDDIALASSRESLWHRMQEIAEGRFPLVPSAHFDPRRAREAVRTALEAGPEGASIRQLAYRPLDTRFVCAVAPLCHRPRPELLAAVAQSQLCLLSSRKDRGSLPFMLFAAVHDAADACFLSTRSSCRTRVFPSHGPDGSENLSPALLEIFARLGVNLSAEQFILYSLGALSSHLYREQQGERLKMDYPRVPIPREAAAVQALVRAGRIARDALCSPLESLAVRKVSMASAEDHEESVIELRQACFSRDDEMLRFAEGPRFCGVSAAIWDSSVGHTPWRRLGPQRAKARDLGCFVACRVVARRSLRCGRGVSRAFLAITRVTRAKHWALTRRRWSFNLGFVRSNGPHFGAEFRAGNAKYFPRAKLACGGMAEVWRGEAQLEGGRVVPVAFKRVLTDLADSPLYRQLLEDEGRLGMLLSHPNIVRVYDACELNGSFVLVMELVEGCTLREVLRHLHSVGGRIPLSAVLRIGRALASALSASHEAVDEFGRDLSIVHCDVSPQNVLIAEDGTVKLMDFGLAVSTANRSDLDRLAIGGKPGYLAPEVVLWREISPALDLFALGVVLWECLTGQRLFQGKDEEETSRRIVRCDVPPVSQLVPALPREFDELFAVLLAREPERRHASARDLSAELEYLSVRFGRQGGQLLGRAELRELVASALMASAGVPRRHSEVREAVKGGAAQGLEPPAFEHEPDSALTRPHGVPRPVRR
ncbi:MAG: protein kinase [Myxococcales bacterium]